MIKIEWHYSMAYHGRYQKPLWSLLRAMDYSGQKQIESYCVINRYSRIEFAVAQESPSSWVTTITVSDTDWVRKGGREDGGTLLWILNINAILKKVYPSNWLPSEQKTSVFHIALRVGSIPTLQLKIFEQLFWPTTFTENSRKAQWQAQSRYLFHCAFLVSFRYAGSEKTWLNHFISIPLALVTIPAVLRR